MRGEINIENATEAGWSPHLVAWNAYAGALPVAAAFGQVPVPVYPYFWRTNHARIVIWKLRESETP